jgi:hypothetical protein
VPIRDFVAHIAAKYSIELRDSWIVCNEKDSGLEGHLQDYLGQELSVQQLSSELARELSLFGFDDFGDVESGLGMNPSAPTTSSSQTSPPNASVGISIPHINLGPHGTTPSPLSTGPKAKPRLDLAELVASKPYSFDAPHNSATISSSSGMALGGGSSPSGGLGAQSTSSRDPTQLASNSSALSQNLTAMTSNLQKEAKKSTQRVQSGKKSPRQVAFGWWLVWFPLFVSV